MDQEEAIRQRYQLLAPELNERTLRLFAAAEAKVIGWGGIAVVSRTLEISRERISRGLAELEMGDTPQPGRIRRKGGGRKREVDIGFSHRICGLKTASGALPPPPGFSEAWLPCSMGA